LEGYRQLEGIAKYLGELCTADPHNVYWRQLSLQVQRTLDKNRVNARQLAEAHGWLLQIADCLRYPPSAYPSLIISGQQVAQEMEQLLQTFSLEPKGHRPQNALRSRLFALWKGYGDQLLPCYDIPGLPPDNLQLESYFNRLRRRQRRISGRKTTRELNRLGHYQALFTAESEAELLEHLRQVPYSVYLDQRRKVHQAEEKHRFLRRLHRDPEKTLKKQVGEWIAHEQSGQAAMEKSHPNKRDNLCDI
jgi:hypothetical protein